MKDNQQKNETTNKDQKPKPVKQTFLSEFISVGYKIMKKIFIILAIIILVPFAYCQIKYPSYTYRYKVTVEVETPQGLKTGSSVVEVHEQQAVKSLKIIWNDQMNIKGEGTIVDIAEGKTLFVLLNGAPSEGNPHALIYSAIPIPKGYGRYDKYYANLKNAKGVLPRDKYPRMVYFEDINKPISVKEVNPDNMEEYFGKGVKIKQITVETTRDKLEWKMEGKLKWLREYDNKLFDGRTVNTTKAENPIANSLGSGDFAAW